MFWPALVDTNKMKWSCQPRLGHNRMVTIAVMIITVSPGVTQILVFIAGGYSPEGDQNLQGKVQLQPADDLNVDFHQDVIYISHIKSTSVTDSVLFSILAVRPDRTRSIGLLNLHYRALQVSSNK